MVFAKDLTDHFESLTLGFGVDYGHLWGLVQMETGSYQFSCQSDAAEEALFLSKAIEIDWVDASVED